MARDSDVVEADSARTAGPEGSHGLNSANQLTDAGFAYNSEGALTAGGTLSALAYNGLAQTTSITPQGGAAVPYTYAGRARQRISAGATTDAFGLLGLSVETTAGATTNYVRNSAGGLVYEHTPGGDFYYVMDGQGSVIALVDPTGVQRAAYTYDPYGDHATATALNGPLPANPWRWEASYLDTTGLYKLGARYYDPHLGRFTQVDPIASGSCNDYDYACGDPINRFDATGLADFEPIPIFEELRGLGAGYYPDAIGTATCVNYRDARVTGIADYFYHGAPSPVQHDFDKALQAICSVGSGPAGDLGIGGFGRTIAGNKSFDNSGRTVLIGTAEQLIGTISRASAKISPYLTAAATVADAGCTAIKYFG